MAVALLPSIDKDRIYTGLTAWTPALVGDPNIQITGTTYDLEMINGVDYLVEKRLLSKGDTIGHLYFEGDYGEGGLIGSKDVASRQGLKLVEQKIKATDTDMSGPVAAFKRAGVKAILMHTAGRSRPLRPPASQRRRASTSRSCRAVPASTRSCSRRRQRVR